MKWISDRWDVLKEVAGPRRYMLLGLVSAVLFAADWLTRKVGQLLAKWMVLPVPKSEEPGMVFGFPSWGLGVTVIFFFYTWWFLDHLVERNKRISGARVHLSTLRHAGVDIRNDGRFGIQTAADWNHWKSRAEEWEIKVIENIEIIDKGCAEWFRILDVVPQPRLHLTRFSEDHQKLYNEHDFRVKRLGELIQELWR